MKKFIGIDAIIDRVLKRIGHLHSAYIIGDFARGIDNKLIELLLVGSNLDDAYISELIEKAEKMIGRKISVCVLSLKELPEFLDSNNNLLIWQSIDDISANRNEN